MRNKLLTSVDFPRPDSPGIGKMKYIYIYIVF